MFFIKIVRNRHETVHQCESYICEQTNGRLHLDIKQSSKSIYEDVECIPECRVFIMNENGKTIDRKTWSNR